MMQGPGRTQIVLNLAVHNLFNYCRSYSAGGGITEVALVAQRSHWPGVRDGPNWVT